MDTYLSFTLKYFIATTSLLLLAAAFIFWEAFSYSWYLWSDCWFSLSSERAWHPQDEDATGYCIIFRKNFRTFFGRFI
jgi:hypothetical protein